MGLSRNICIEPFIRIPIQYKDYEYEIRTCGEHENENCDKYCPICGKPIYSIILKEKREINTYWELINDMEDEAFCSHTKDSWMYLWSNYQKGLKIDTDANIYTQITPELMSDMIDDFKNTHKEDILRLEARLNREINVEFGFLYHVW